MSDSATNKAEIDWQAHAANMQKPAIINYMVCPHVPEGADTLLSPDGEPFMLSYTDLDYKKLANNLQRTIHGMLPKGIKVYVGNDALDLFDINLVNHETGMVDDSYNYLGAALDCFARTKISDFRAGIAKICDPGSGLHLNSSTLGKRPPVSALFVSIRFATFVQLADYMATAAECILGVVDYVSSQTKQGDVIGTCVMPPALAQWLYEDGGAVYGDQCTILRLSTTFSQEA